MQQKALRPNKKDINTVIKDITELHKSLLNIANSEISIKKAIEQEADSLRQTSALAEMALIDVDAINADKQGLRISALKTAGITNMSQLCGMPVHKISNVDGIGEQTAIKVKQITDKMYSAIISSAKIQINLENRTASQDIVVQNLYILRNGDAYRTQANTLLSSEKDIENTLQEARPASGMFKWLFSSKEKKNTSVQAYERLTSLSKGIFGQQVRICSEAHDDILKNSIGNAYVDFEKNAVAYYTLLEGLGLVAPKQRTTGLPDDLVFAIEQYPLNLTHMKTPLRHYQTFGAKYMLNQEKALLGDEMGLGKTIQALAVIADMRSRGITHFLVVCPASVLVNWQRETTKHTNIISVIIHGADREFDFEQWKTEGGIGITNFESLLKLADKMEFAYGALVVDEAHFIKNPEAQRTKALIKAGSQAGSIIFMTGTPLENRVEEMCFLVSCLRPDIAKKLSTMKTLSATQSFKSELAPLYLRRIRDDVLTELPDLIKYDDWIEPTNEEMVAYFKLPQDEELDRHYKSLDIEEHYNHYRTADLKSESIDWGAWMHLRRVSWHDEVVESSKAKRLVEICNDAQDEGRKVLVFSFFRKTLARVCDLLGERAIGPITGSVSTVMRQQLVDEFTEADSGAVLVAQVQAGGVGLNIQSASVVIFCEPQVKPSLESQAISRAYRMGQVRNVHVHRLLCVDTIDEHMIKMLECKQTEFDTYADESVVGVESLKEQSENTWIKDVIAKEKMRIATLQNPVEQEMRFVYD